MALTGAALALLSAALFGASTPLAKLLLRNVDPVMLAGVLYAGSGVGLLAASGARRIRGAGVGREAALRGRQWLWLALAVLAGGVAAPALLMYGLAGASAAATALLLNLEPIFTVLLAWLVFGEAVGRRIAIGMAAIAAGALVLTWQGGSAAGGAGAMLAVAAACLGWAIDNNVTRKIALTDPVRIAAVKGCAAGLVNIAAALSRGAPLPSPGVAAAAGVLGLIGYGVSLVLFVRALREIGAARTGAYFSLAPFFGALVSVVLFRDELSGQLALAGALMGVGVWLHLTERHAHEHRHPELEHDHAHVHDAHHQHAHAEGAPAREPHSHRHRHDAAPHHHPHFPDVHHEHPH
jgi:drug/metabolite transporter (DMT)-like permease